jgi:hypothetical protein
MITIAMTQAKTGRSIKKFAMITELYSGWAAEAGEETAAISS